MSDLKNTEAIWAPMSEILKSKHVDTAYNLWFGDMQFVSLTPKEAMFTTTLNLKRDVILENFAEEMQDALCQVVNFRPRIVVISTENEEIDLSAPKIEHFEKVERGEIAPDENIVMPDDYRSDYTFENFIVGASNEFAYAAARAVADKNLDDPETLRSNNYNPLFIYGPSGVGKTHLLYAITNRLAKRYPSKKIVYIKGEEFTNQLVEAIRNKTTFEFREKFRRVDVLLIDTAGRLHNKKNLMEELRKMNRIIDKEYPNAHRENLIVLDGTTGQNALVQAREFGEVADLTGIVLTKMDGTAKGGIAVSIQSELKVPVKYIGVGETIEDLQKFDSDEFVNALFDVKTGE